MDRTFDAACLTVKNETEWSSQILTRLRNGYPDYIDRINQLYEFYVTMVSNNDKFLSRADYMIENRGKLKLRFK